MNAASAPRTVLVIDYNTSPRMLSGQSLITLLRHLDSSRYRAVVVFNRVGAYSIAADTCAAETMILPHGGGHFARRAWQYGLLAPSLWSLARRVKPSLIYANNVMAARPAILLKALTGLPAVVHIRNVGLFPRTAPLVLRADRFLAVSRATASGTLPSGMLDRTDVVNDGIDLAHYPVADQNSRVTSRLKLGIPHNRFVIGMAGRLTAQKGQRLFVEMAKQISAQRADVIFVHAGGVPSAECPGTYEHSLCDASGEMTLADRFRWLPYVDDMATFWSALDIAIVPSGGPEAFSRAVIEAMACGVPVVATKSGDPKKL